MTIEYVLLVTATFFFIVKGMLTIPNAAFKKSGPRLAARVEQQIETGAGFKPMQGNKIKWEMK